VTRAILFAAIGGLCLLPLGAGAQELGSSVAATTKPAHSLMDRRQAARVREGLGTFRPGDKALDEPLTPQDKADIEKFMTTYSPERWNRFQDIPEDRKTHLEKLIRVKMRQLQRTKEEDPQIYELQIKRLPIEDQMFALGWQLKHEEPREPKNGELHKKLKETVKQFVESSIEERRIRLERQQENLQQMQARVTDESSKIKDIANNKDQWIERGISSIENDGGEAFRGMAAPGWPHRQRESTGPATEPSADSGAVASQ
jgi:hypothetical protein